MGRAAAAAAAADAAISTTTAGTKRAQPEKYEDYMGEEPDVEFEKRFKCNYWEETKGMGRAAAGDAAISTTTAGTKRAQPEKYDEDWEEPAAAFEKRFKCNYWEDPACAEKVRRSGTLLARFTALDYHSDCVLKDTDAWIAARNALPGADDG